MARPKLLDLFCGAGGAAMGYYRAGFDVVGVDIRSQPHYPFTFIQGDALNPPVKLSAFDAIHASPPCQANIKGLGAVNKILGRQSNHRDVIEKTREFLKESAKPYIIENVEGSALKWPIKICGSSFGLLVRRHRLFESSCLLLSPLCMHENQRARRFWTSWRPNGEVRLAGAVQVYGNAGDRSYWKVAMGIDWMDWRSMTQAIPPAYTEFIGRQLMQIFKPKEKDQ